MLLPYVNLRIDDDTTLVVFRTANVQRVASLKSSSPSQLIRWVLKHYLQLSSRQTFDNLNYIGLIETKFPYYFNSSNQKALTYVSFSHSPTYLAVVLSRQILYQPYIGVDIEDRKISFALAKRYYSDNEITLLSNYSASVQRMLITILWTIKEAHIKSCHPEGINLLQGLKVDFSSWLTTLIIPELSKGGGLENVLRWQQDQRKTKQPKLIINRCIHTNIKLSYTQTFRRLQRYSLLAVPNGWVSCLR